MMSLSNFNLVSFFFLSNKSSRTIYEEDMSKKSIRICDKYTISEQGFFMSAYIQCEGEREKKMELMLLLTLSTFSGKSCFDKHINMQTSY